MSDWKFKVGDVVKDRYNTYTILKCDNITNCYEIIFEGERMVIYKDLMETECELAKPKSLYEQALELLDLKPMEEFMFRGKKYYFDRAGNLIYASEQGGYVKEYNFGLEVLLFNKDAISKLKSEAELILDELEKVVDKAKAVLERSGR